MLDARRAKIGGTERTAEHKEKRQSYVSIWPTFNKAGEKLTGSVLRSRRHVTASLIKCSNTVEVPWHANKIVVVDPDRILQNCHELPDLLETIVANREGFSEPLVVI